MMSFLGAVNRLLICESRQFISKLQSRMCLRSTCKRNFSSQWTSEEHKIKPFWKVKAELDNVSLELKSDGLEKIVITGEDTEKDIRVMENSEDEAVKLCITASKPQTPFFISVPYQADLDIVMRGSGTARVCNIENKVTAIAADEQGIEIQNVKSHEIHAESATGNIICSNIVKGNVFLKATKGDISTEKIQGNTASLMSEEGSVSIGDIYTKDMYVRTGKAVKMRNVHGDCEIESKGDITIGTAEGRINAISESGNIHVYLTEKVEHADIVTNTGNIALSFCPDLGGQLDVEAQSIYDLGAKSSLKEVRQRQQGPCLRYRAELKDGGPRMSVKALGGTVILQTSSWLDAVSSFKKMDR